MLRSRTALVSSLTLATAMSLGLASAAVAADVQTYPSEVYPGLTVQSPYPNYVLDLDCDVWDPQGERYQTLALNWVPGGSLEVNFDCDMDDVDPIVIASSLAAEYPPGFTSLLDSTVGADQFTIDPNTEVNFTFGAKAFGIVYYTSEPIDDPSGSLLFTETMTTPANGTQTIDFGTGASALCDVDKERVYASLEFTILDSGEYTFRVVDVFPLQGGEDTVDEGWYFYPPNPWGDYLPIADTYFVLYSDFDPSNPNDNQIYCNDDSDSTIGDGIYYSRDSADRLIPNTYSELILSLEPGQYTLVLTTYDTVADTVPTAASKVNEFSAALDSAVYPLAGLPEQSADVQLWGAQNGLVLGHVAFLAETGVDSRLPLGLAIGSLMAMIVGALAIVIVRRRATATST
jgi:hypothetical protein